MGLLCFLLFCVGALLIMFSGKRNQRETIGFVLAAAAFLIYGISSLHERQVVKTSPHPTTSGSVLSYEEHGNRSRYSSLRILTDTGHRVWIHLDSAVPNIEKGDRVKYQYVQETGGTLNFQVLSGRALGTFVGDEDQDLYPYLWMFGAVVFGTVGVLSRVARRRRGKI